MKILKLKSNNCYVVRTIILQLYLLNLIKHINRSTQEHSNSGNEAYGVLRGGGGGGVSLSVNWTKGQCCLCILCSEFECPHSSQPVHYNGTNAACEVTSVKPDYVYEIPNIQT